MNKRLIDAYTYRYVEEYRGRMVLHVPDTLEDISIYLGDSAETDVAIESMSMEEIVIGIAKATGYLIENSPSVVIKLLVKSTLDEYIRMLHIMFGFYGDAMIIKFLNLSIETLDTFKADIQIEKDHIRMKKFLTKMLKGVTGGKVEYDYKEPLPFMCK